MASHATLIDHLPSVRRFVAVAETGGFTSAAHQLGLTVNQVSRGVQRLEEALGVRLLHRTTRAVALTAHGERLLGPARRILAAVLDAEQAMAVDDTTLSGRVRVALPSLVVTPSFLEHLGGWLDHHQAIALELVVTDAPLDVVSEALDVQLRFTIPTQATLLFRRVATFTATLSAHRSYVEAHGLPDTPHDLAHHECLRFFDGSPAESWSFLHRDGLELSVPIGGRLSCDTSLVLAEALRAGLGIGPRAAGAPPEPDLIDVLPEWELEPMPLWAVQPPAHRRQPAVNSLLAMISRLLDGWLPDERAPAPTPP